MSGQNNNFDTPLDVNNDLLALPDQLEAVKKYKEILGKTYETSFANGKVRIKLQGNKKIEEIYVDEDYLKEVPPIQIINSIQYEINSLLEQYEKEVEEAQYELNLQLMNYLFDKDKANNI